MPKDNIVKSQDELNTCNDGKRSSDVLLSTINLCEMLQHNNRELQHLIIKCAQSVNNAMHWLYVTDDFSDITRKSNQQKAFEELTSIYKEIKDWKNLSL